MSINARLLGFVLASNYRKIVLLKLLEGPKTPTELSKGISVVSEQISRTIRELQNKGLVQCLNPEARKGRVYSLTPSGKTIALELKRRKI